MGWRHSRLCIIAPIATALPAAAYIAPRWRRNLQLPLETNDDGLKQVAQAKLIDHMQFFDN
jgi:hypothetical protein